MIPAIALALGLTGMTGGLAEARAPKAREVVRLRPDEVHEASIDESAPPVETPTLERDYRSGAVRGRTFEVVVPEGSGPLTVEVRSLAFDAYLVVRDDGGVLLGEDDDGWYGTHSRWSGSGLPAGATVRIEVAALHGGAGGTGE